jgi:predicted transcriptional regulator
MELNLRFRELDEDGNRVELVGSYRLPHVLVDAICPKVKSIIRRFKNKYPIQASEMANVNITSYIIENGADKDAHLLMIYDQLISTF